MEEESREYRQLAGAGQKDRGRVHGSITGKPRAGLEDSATQK